MEIWGSESNPMLRVLESLSWKCIYHRVRMRPGKAIAFGFVENKAFFCLPGGPRRTGWPSFNWPWQVYSTCKAAASPCNPGTDVAGF
jgi:hypothetical protein